MRAPVRETEIFLARRTTSRWNSRSAAHAPSGWNPALASARPTWFAAHQTISSPAGSREGRSAAAARVHPATLSAETWGRWVAAWAMFAAGRGQSSAAAMATRPQPTKPPSPAVRRASPARLMPPWVAARKIPARVLPRPWPAATKIPRAARVHLWWRFRLFFHPAECGQRICSGGCRRAG
jgi:hypothetical protein